jgi:uncharacterized protein (TIGR02466 family)
MPGKIETVFPTFIYRGRLPGRVRNPLNKELSREIAALEKIDDHGREWSRTHYHGGYSSYSSLSSLHATSPNFGWLRDLLNPHVRSFVKALNWDLQKKRLQMTTCWANSMGVGTHHTLHLHPMSLISGVYYVNLPKGSAPFKIEDPRMGFLMAAPPRRSKAPANQQHYLLIHPEPGEFILFESWMRHEVPPHRGRERRLSVSFKYEL